MRPLLRLSAAGLLLAGVAALVLAATGRFLPHDEHYLGMTAADLCDRHGCRVVHFMIHDRGSFGGSLVAIGVLYFWLTDGPLRAGKAWAWWALAASGAVGFASFFAYLGYGYLDTWHGLATLALFPCFAVGLAGSYPGGPVRLADWGPWRSVVGVGRALLLMTGVGLAGAGLTIMGIGMTCVFVAQDVAFMGVDAVALNDLNPRLVPLIAHDRAGFGGAVCVLGLIVLAATGFGTPTRGLWLALTAAGTVGFGTAIGVHPAVGYTDPIHLAPAILGALMLAIGLVLICQRSFARKAAVGLPPSGCSSVNRLKAVIQPKPLPPLRVLGPDLLTVRPWERVFTLTLPFVWTGAYFAFAFLGWWPAAVFSLVALSFVTYGSSSHDLVHRTLGLPRRLNDWLLCIIELLALRSGHAYQAAHLHHHARFPHPDDVEATAAGRSLLRALAEGPVYVVKLWLWAVRNARPVRAWVVGEGVACLVLMVVAIALIPVTPVFAIYAGLMIAGSWIIPLATSYLPHDPKGETPLSQTRLFRGRVASAVALGHLYHLEHHLYPAVPHRRWPLLAKRLDPHLARARVHPIRLGF